jgi:hypothetical protein
MKSLRLVTWALSLAAVAAGSVYLVGRARAAGAPATSPMTYSGTLTDTSGTPLTGSKNLQVQLWDMATGGTIVCTTGSAPQILVNGGFSLALDPCVAAVHANPDLWAEVLVDGASTGRAKLGAVPFALEADTASKAARDVAGNPMRICSGSTPVGTTAWMAYGAAPGQIVVTIDTTACHFTTKPIYLPVLAGVSSHWTTTGGSNPYTVAATEQTQFQVYINNGTAGISPTVANDTGHLWHIDWIAIGN